MPLQRYYSTVAEIIHKVVKRRYIQHISQRGERKKVSAIGKKEKKMMSSYREYKFIA
jgi:U3 small nucleolar ribonucleoprotein component